MAWKTSVGMPAACSAWRGWQQLQREYSDLQQSQQQRDAQRQLLEYQVAELDNFAPLDNEYPQLEAEHSRLSHGNTLLSQSQQCLQLMYDDEQQNIYQALSVVSAQLDQLTALDPALPFGGYKMSGVGREMGSAAIEHYTELKSVLIKL